MFDHPRRPIPSALAAGLALALALPAPADEPRPDAYQPRARALLDEVVKVYKGLPAYADKGEFSFTATVNNVGENGKSKRSVAFARPNKFDFDYGALRVVGDGKTVTSLFEPQKTYAVTPAPETLGAQAIAELPLPGGLNGTVLIGGEGNLPIAVLVDLLTNDDAAKMILEGTDGLKLEDDRKLDDRAVKSLLVDQTVGPDIRMLVDPESKFVRRIELVYDLEKLNANAKAGTKVKEISVAWTPGPIKTEVPAEAFHVEPPKGFTKVEPGQDRGGQEKNPVDQLLGRPSPDFTLTVLDRDGNTKKVRKADLAGKVVMIDFWATWCGPCLAELPEVQKMVDAYAKDKKDVVVVALSQDEDPKDLSELRKLVEKTLQEKDLKLMEGPVSMVALDPANEVGQAFRVNAYPTVVLLDARGVVQAAHVGYSPNVRQVLTRDIDTLLEGKSLVKAEAGGDDPGKADTPKD